MLPFRFRRRAAPAPGHLGDLRHAWHEFAHLDDARWQRLCDLAARFLATKRIVGAGGFEIDETVRWTIALLACLPILELDLRAYADFVDVIVYPSPFLVDREQTDAAGVVHASRDVLAGEAMDLGPVVLAWSDIEEDRAGGRSCVVIHEFVHKLDMAGGEADGIPIGAAARAPGWERILDASYEEFCARLDAVEAAIPHDVDPESPAADHWYEQLALDSYAATDPVEFLAVAGETFFSAPQRLHAGFPALFDAMRRYFDQDPRLDAKAGSTPPQTG